MSPSHPPQSHRTMVINSKTGEPRYVYTLPLRGDRLYIAFHADPANGYFNAGPVDGYFGFPYEREIVLQLHVLPFRAPTMDESAVVVLASPDELEAIDRLQPNALRSIGMRRIP